MRNLIIILSLTIPFFCFSQNIQVLDYYTGATNDGYGHPLCAEDPNANICIFIDASGGEWESFMDREWQAFEDSGNLFVQAAILTADQDSAKVRYKFADDTYSGTVKFEMVFPNHDYCYAILPVEIVDFDVRKRNDNEVLLSWETKTEINNAGFRVLHSQNARNWQSLGFVEGQGTTEDNTVYEFTHKFPNYGKNYYKLVQIDFDGAFEEFEIKEIRINSPESEISIRQNGNEINVHTKSLEKSIITVFDLNGHIFSRGFYEKEDCNITINDLDVGIYFVSKTTENGIVNNKFVISE